MNRMMEHEQKIKELIECDLKIKRVPKKQLDWFKDYAKEEFSGDYGMTLREIIMFYQGNYLNTYLSGLQSLHDKVDKLLLVQESTLKQPKTTVKMANGRERSVE